MEMVSNRGWLLRGKRLYLPVGARPGEGERADKALPGNCRLQVPPDLDLSPVKNDSRQGKTSA
jgi:hypothetical protein